MLSINMILVWSNAYFSHKTDLLSNNSGQFVRVHDQYFVINITTCYYFVTVNMLFLLEMNRPILKIPIFDVIFLRANYFSNSHIPLKKVMKYWTFDNMSIYSDSFYKNIGMQFSRK